MGTPSSTRSTKRAVRAPRDQGRLQRLGRGALRPLPLPQQEVRGRAPRRRLDDLAHLRRVAQPPPAPPAGPARCSAAEHMGLHFDLRTFFDSHLSDGTAAAIKGSSGPHCKDISSKAFRATSLRATSIDSTCGLEGHKTREGSIGEGLGTCTQWTGLCHESKLNADGSYKDSTGTYSAADEGGARPLPGHLRHPRGRTSATRRT